MKQNKIVNFEVSPRTQTNFTTIGRAHCTYVWRTLRTFECIIIRMEEEKKWHTSDTTKKKFNNKNKSLSSYLLRREFQIHSKLNLNEKKKKWKIVHGEWIGQCGKWISELNFFLIVQSQHYRKTNVKKINLEFCSIHFGKCQFSC